MILNGSSPASTTGLKNNGMEQKISTRGGARPGSGRKPISENKRRGVTISFRVRESTRAAIQELRSQGVDINAELEQMISRLIDVDNVG